MIDDETTPADDAPVTQDGMSTARAPYHHGNLREELVTAAKALIADEGVEGVSLRAVARRAGVSQAAPYHHFKDKESLLAAVAEEGFVHLRQALVRHADVRDPIERLRHMGRDYLAFATENRATYGLMWSSKLGDKSCHTGLDEAGHSCFEVLLGAIAEGQARGLFAGEHPLPAALVAWSSVHGLASLLIDGIQDRQKMEHMPKDPGVLGDLVMDGVLNGLRPRLTTG